MLPRDLQAIRQAFPQERAFQESNPFETNGPGLQGSPKYEPYDIGRENNALDQGQFNQGVSMGGLNAANLYPVSNPFPGQTPTYDQYQGYDSMRGIVTGALPASLSNDQMYLTPSGATSFHEFNAQPTNPRRTVE